MTATSPLSSSSLSSLLAFVLARAWTVHRPLVILGFSLLALLALTGAGIFLDPTVITGMPAWVKPSKFALSLAIYAFTTVWLLGYLPERRRFVRAIGNIVTATAVIEIAVIAGQAWRGKVSHFNQESLLDGMLFTAMGISILLLYVAAIATAVALARAKIADRAFASAVRLGLVVSIVGMGQAGLMLVPTSGQADAMAAGETVTRVGSHTVGALDGGPGLPFVGWSTEAGDLRVGHFLGMHAVQVLPLFAWLLARRRLAESKRLSLVRTASGAYLAIVALVTWQALRGQPLLAPDARTLGALGLIVVTSSALAAAGLRGRGAPAPARVGAEVV
jgi:hypothetical protein